MTYGSRRPRPLVRDAETLRDTRLFIVATDDTYAPLQYFSFFQLSRVQVHVVPSRAGRCDANTVLDALLDFDAEDGDERWLLLDCDHFTQGTHLRSFRTALTKARKAGVSVALSRPCFDLWLLLHHCDASDLADFEDCPHIIESLRERLGAYNKTRLRMKDFPPSAVARAIVAARSLDESVGGGDIPQSNTTRVYRLWLSILRESLPRQLPPELASLRDRA
ncbi:MAG TPA: hypothetical protein DEH78_26265 [Solibacterales bacterium]|nr:hypothetical protein [Bryobacterales bacterium]